MVQSRSEKYWFGDFLLDTTEWVLRREGEVLPVAPKALKALELLVRNAGRVVSRSELIESVWPDTGAAEPHLNVTISMLRRALGDSEELTMFIKTVPSHGYCFVRQVKFEELSEAQSQESQVSVNDCLEGRIEKTTDATESQPTKTPQERLRLWDQWLSSHDYIGAPPLSDEAISRENIYREREDKQL